jgi:putative nucleotidyltransferase with HDIG domain
MMDFHIDALPRQKGVFIVGGFLRDRLLGKKPTDVDIVVQDDPELFARELATKLNRRVLSMGRPAHPMFRVVTKHHIFDISPLQGASIEEDLKQRDFTINALAYETFSARTIDVAHGLQDIQDKQIRQISKSIFRTDPLRLLRAFRIAAQLGFQIEKQTQQAIQKDARLISEAAAERIRWELFGILEASNTHVWLQKMANSGILFNILPEMAAMKDCFQNRHHAFDVFDHTIQTVRQMEILTAQNRSPDTNPSPVTEAIHRHRQSRLKLAALLHDIGKPLTRQAARGDQFKFTGHASAGARMVADIGNRLRFSRAEIGHAEKMVQYHLRPLLLFMAKNKGTLTQRGITRFFMKTHPDTKDILLLCLADMRGKQALEHARESKFEQFVTKLAQQYDTQFRTALEVPSFISGHDLIHLLHLTPSPLFKQVLARTRECQLAGKITTRKEALKFATDAINSIGALEA